jgi:hypothetical protein
MAKEETRKSVLVIDNASYHNVTVEANPNSSWKKAPMQNWLTEKGVFFEYSYMRKAYIMDDVEDLIISVRADESENDSDFYIS